MLPWVGVVALTNPCDNGIRRRAQEARSVSLGAETWAATAQRTPLFADADEEARACAQQGDT